MLRIQRCPVSRNIFSLFDPTQNAQGRPVEFARADIAAGAFVFALALVVRTIYLAYWIQSPYYGVPLLDEQYHHDWAMRVAAGSGYEAKPFFRAPLYPYFLAAIYRFVSSEPIAPRLIQALLGSLSALLTFLLAYRLFNRTTAMVAGFIAAVYPVMVFYDGELLLPPLLVFLDLLFAHALLSAWQSGKGRWWFATGVIGGLSAITRPNILLPMMAIGGMLLLGLRRHRNESGVVPPQSKARKAILAAAALYALGAALAILPVTVRNRVHGGDWVLIASQGGIVLYAGNGPEADGFTPRQKNLYTRLETYQDTFEQYAKVDAEKALGRSLRPSEVSRYWSQQTRNYIAEHPERFLKLLGRKAIGWWTRVEVRNNKTVEYALQFAPPLLALHKLLNFALIGTLSLVGMFWSAKTKPLTRPILVLVLIYAASFLPFFVCDRYRLPMVPFLIVYAAWAAVSVMAIVAQVFRPAHGQETPQSVNRRQKNGQAGKPAPRKALVIACFALLASGLLVCVDWFDLDPQPTAEDAFMVSICHEKKGELVQAEEALQEAVEKDPRHYNALHNIGKLALQKGSLAEAEEYFLRSIQAFPRFATAWNSLGVVYLQTKQLDQAREAFNKCLQLDPNHALAHWNLAKIYRSEGKIAEAEEHEKNALRILPSLAEKPGNRLQTLQQD